MSIVADLPLAGWHVLVPRRPDGPDPLVIATAAAGAEPVTVELISTTLPEDTTDLDDLLLALGIGYYSWIGFTSAAALPALVDRAQDVGTGLAALTGQTLVAAVGQSTARALRDEGLRVALVPTGTSSAAALLAAWPPVGPEGGRVLLPHGDLAAPTLATGLRSHGWEVDEVVAYRTVTGPPPDPALAAAYAAGEIDAVLLTSGSTARALVELVGVPPASTLVCCIGRSTAEVARSVGLRVDAVAADQTPAGLVRALVDAVASTVEPAPGTAPVDPPAPPAPPPFRPPFHPIRR